GASAWVSLCPTLWTQSASARRWCCPAAFGSVDALSLDQRQAVPDAPELFHLFRRAQGDTGISVERGKGTADSDVVFGKISDQNADRPTGRHHDKVCARGSRLNLARPGLAHELVAIPGVALNRQAIAGGVIHRGHGAAHNKNIQAVFQAV